MKNLIKNKKGFTIVELVIVIAVIGILASVLIPTFAGIVDKANGSAAQQEAKSALSNVLAMSNNASLNDGTKFVIDSNGKNTDTSFLPEYVFKYQDAKLQSDESFKISNGAVADTAKIKLVDAKSQSDTTKEAKYDIVVSTKAIKTNTPESGTATITFTGIVKGIIDTYTSDTTTTITLTSPAAGTDYYTFQIDSVDVRVYVSSDLEDNIVVFSAK